MAFPATGILDSFTGADENPLTTNWTCPLFSTEGVLQRVSNQIKGTVGGAQYNNGWYDLSQFGPDCEAYCTIVTRGDPDDEISIFARIQPGTEGGAVDGYLLRWIKAGAGNDIIRIRRIDNGSSSALGADITSESVQAGDKLGLSCIGNTITAYRCPVSTGIWASLGSRSDSTYPGAGYLGISIQDLVAVVDDFGGGNAGQTILPDADIASGGWTTSPLYSKLNDASDATIITATAS